MPIALFVGPLLAAGLFTAEIDPYDQTRVPLEVDAPARKGVAKIVLLAGKASHGPGHHEYFAGMALLRDLLAKQKEVFPVMARDGWPKNEKILEGARAIVLFADGGKGHPVLVGERAAMIDEHVGRGGGVVAIHYAVNFPAEASERVLPWLGGHFHPETSSSPASTWTAEYKAIPRHPITRGVPPFTLRDEWYYNMRFAPDGKGVTPLLEAVPPEETRTSADAKKHPGRAEVTAWAYERPAGGRAFGFTGGHYHENWGNESFRRLLVNGILWAAGLEVPAKGAKVPLPDGALERNLDDKRKK